MLAENLVNQIADEGLEEISQYNTWIDKLEGCIDKLTHRKETSSKGLFPESSIKDLAKEMNKSPDALYQSLHRTSQTISVSGSRLNLLNHSTLVSPNLAAHDEEHYNWIDQYLEGSLPEENGKSLTSSRRFTELRRQLRKQALLNDYLHEFAPSKEPEVFRFSDKAKEFYECLRLYLQQPRWFCLWAISFNRNRVCSKGTPNSAIPPQNQ